MNFTYLGHEKSVQGGGLFLLRKGWSLILLAGSNPREDVSEGICIQSGDGGRQRFRNPRKAADRLASPPAFPPLRLSVRRVAFLQDEGPASKGPFLPVPPSDTGSSQSTGTNRRSGKFGSGAREKESLPDNYTNRIRGERKVRRFVSNVGRKVPRGREPSKYCWGQQVSRASGLRPVAYHTGILPRATGVTTQRDIRSVTYCSICHLLFAVSNHFDKTFVWKLYFYILETPVCMFEGLLLEKKFLKVRICKCVHLG